MENIFTQKELKTAIDVIVIGLTESAKSLGNFIKSETKLELGNDFSISDRFLKENLSKKEGFIYLLTSELIGDLKGMSYLLFTESDVTAIMKSRYANIPFDDVKYKRKLESLIIEVDNIITAGVMSQFANAFKYRTYGGVPKLNIVTFENAIKIIEQGTGKNEFILGFNAQLISKNAEVKADFIWSVDNAFVEGVKNIKKQ